MRERGMGGSGGIYICLIEIYYMEVMAIWLIVVMNV